MKDRTKQESSIKRVSILHDQLISLRRSISPIQDIDSEELKKSYAELEDAFSKVFKAEAKYQVEI